MPQIDISSYTDLPPNDLEAMRRQLVAKAQGNHDNLSIDDLHQLAAITGVLRRRASGPPKAAKKPSTRAEKPKKAELGDLI